jgi:hypothetical protein
MRHAQRDWQRSWNTEGISRSTRQTTRAVMTSKKHFRKKKMKLHGLCDALIEKQAKEDPREFASVLQTRITGQKHGWER